MEPNRPQFMRAAKKQLRACKTGSIAATIRWATTESPNCTAREMVAAGVELGYNPLTVRKQFAQARKEDAEIEACTKGMTRKQVIDAIVRTVLGK